MEYSLLYLPSFKVIQLQLSDADLRVGDLLTEHELSINDNFVLCNGRLAASDDILQNGCCYRIQPRLRGGKGGFGSMLRALGAQIEKTTNREACRDLSGRRMRDVNNEKKLREWAAKASEREKEREEKRRERRERLKAGASRHKFSDPEYDQQKTRIAEDLDKALREALKDGGKPNPPPEAVACCSKESRKRKATSGSKADEKKAREWIGVDVDLSSSSSSDAEADAEAQQNFSSDEQDSRSSSDVVSSQTEPNDSTCDSVISNAATADKSNNSTVSDGATSEQSSSATVLASSSQQPSVEVLPETDSKSLDQAAVVSQPINLDDYDSVEALAKLGLDVLKTALTERGLKCGGTLEQRAQRLFSVKGLSLDQIDKSLLVKPAGRK